MELRVAVFNSIYYLVLHYPVDTNHFTVKKAYLTWLDDLDKNKGSRDAFEIDLCNLLSSNDKGESEQNIKMMTMFCANLALGPDFADMYNNNSNPSPKACELFLALLQTITMLFLI